jgi:hypothetical protein
LILAFDCLTFELLKHFFLKLIWLQRMKPTQGLFMLAMCASRPVLPRAIRNNPSAAKRKAICTFGANEFSNTIFFHRCAGRLLNRVCRVGKIFQVQRQLTLVLLITRIPHPANEPFLFLRALLRLFGFSIHQMLLQFLWCCHARDNSPQPQQMRQGLRV